MITKTLFTFFKRDLKALKTEIELYDDETNLWLTNKNITNSAGNLCLHLIGNLNAYIGADLGNTGYIRKRNLEFSLKNIPRTELICKIDDTILMVGDVLNTLTFKDLKKQFPLDFSNEIVTTEYFLFHLSMHLAYHLGQINYHRRGLD